MTTAARPQSAPSVHPGVGLAQRIYGFGSVFGKTLRDSRRATILVGVVLGLMLIGISKTIVDQFATPQSRTELGDLIRSVPPILQGLAGRPANVESLGGYVNYKYGTFFPLVASLWSILALSGTLAAEARRGSLDFVAATPVTRRRIGAEKLLGHVTVVAVAGVLIFLSLVLAGSFATLPGDEISVAMAAGYALWLCLLALAAGSVAFALAQFLGRGAAVGIAGAVTFAGFLLSGYRAAIPELAPFANLTWFGWTANHLPLAGAFDWVSLVPVAVVVIILSVVGIEAFSRRDLGATSQVPMPRLPDALVGLGGPTARTAGQTLSSALAWGIGLGVFGLLIAGSGRSFVEQLDKSPDFDRLLATIFPNIDIASVGGFLQLVFVEFGLVLAGLAAATLVAGWASDESSGRLEMLLSTPLTRGRWAVSGGLGLVIAVAVVTALAMAGIALGASMTGGEIATPVLGTLSLGLYALAMVGIGVAIAGVVGGGVAGPAVAIVTVVMWFLDIIGPAMKLPDALHELALSAHYGMPMLGRWDAAGVVASLALAVGGVALGAWGFRRRDLER